VSARPLLGASVRGFAAFRLELLLRSRLGPALEEDVRRGLDPRLVEQVRDAYADICEAARQFSESHRVAEPGSTAMVDAAVGASSARGWTTEQVSKCVGLKPRRVRQLLADEVLDGVRVGGQWLVDPASVELFVEARRSA
jgi:hypothetical protein